jgi:hypothetical protein
MRNYLKEAFSLEDKLLEQEEKEIAIKAIQAMIDDLLDQVFKDQTLTV